MKKEYINVHENAHIKEEDTDACEDELPEDMETKTENSSRENVKVEKDEGFEGYEENENPTNDNNEKEIEGDENIEEENSSQLNSANKNPNLVS